MYLITAYFDEQSNKTIQHYIDMVARNTNNTFMTNNRVPPHLTILDVQARNYIDVCNAFETLKGKISSGVISYVSVGQLFPYVMYITPVLNAYLIELQGKVYNAIKDVPEVIVSKYYQPYSWLPHTTIGKKLDKNQMAAAFKVMQDNFVPFDVKICEIGLAKVNPYEDILRFDLSKGDKNE